MRLEKTDQIACPFCGGDVLDCVLCAGSGLVTQTQIDAQAAKVGTIFEDFLTACYSVSPEARETIDRIIEQDRAVMQKAA